MYDIIRILFTLYIAFICFYNLDAISLRIYDEARNAVNALEMYKTKNFLYTTFNYLEDTWNTKPPLFMWIMVFFIFLLGENDWALRLPVALMAAAIAFLLVYFSKTYLKKEWLGWLASIFLFTIPDFTTFHGIRTADYDIPLTFFSISYLFSYYSYYKTLANKYIYIGSIALTCAILTKGVAGLFFIPAILLFTLIKGKFKIIVMQKAFWISLLFPLILGVGYYFLRELYTPGYLLHIWENELGGRLSNRENAGKSEPFFMYFNSILNYQFNKISLLLIGLALPLSLVRKKYSNISIYLFLNAIFFLTAISFSKQKLFWYTIPVYPLLCLLIAISIFHIYEIIQLKYLQWLALILLIFLPNFSRAKLLIQERLYPTDHEAFKTAWSKPLKKAKKKKVQLDTDYLYVDNEIYRPHYLFYSEALKQELSFININQIDFKAENKLAVVHPFLKAYLRENFNVLSEKDTLGISYLSISPVENDKRALYFNQAHLTVPHQPVLLQSTQNPQLIMLRAKSINEVNYLYFKYQHPDGLTEYEVVELNEPCWDNEHTKYIFLKYAPVSVEFGKKNLKGEEITKFHQNFSREL